MTVTPGVSAQNARLVFVIDNDYGELTMAMFFLHRQAIAGRTTLLLPPRLFATNGAGLGVRTLEYKNYAEAVAHLTAEDPHVVILFSGYLLAIHELMSVTSLHMLIEWLRARGCAVATYDPFWGLMATPHLAFSPHFWKGRRFEVVRFLKFLATLPLRPGQKLRFDPNPVAVFSKTSKVLRDVVHLNPAPLVAEGVPITSCFNPQLIGVPPPDAYWLFVLSELDYRVQKAKAGLGDGFARKTAATLSQALAGKRCVVVAPHDAVEEIKSVMRDAGQVEWVTFCPFHQFVSLLVGAEYAFYWNVMTSSSLIRWVNALPVFSFDRGHVSRDMTPVYDAMVEWFFQGWHPITLNQDDQLTVEALRPHAEEAIRVSRRIRERLQQAPTPEELVDQLLGQSISSVSPATL